MSLLDYASRFSTLALLLDDCIDYPSESVLLILIPLLTCHVDDAEGIRSEQPCFEYVWHLSRGSHSQRRVRHVAWACRRLAS